MEVTALGLDDRVVKAELLCEHANNVAAKSAANPMALEFPIRNPRLAMETTALTT